MIEDKKLGLKIAENKTEETWYNVVEGIDADIKALRSRIEKAEKDLTLNQREFYQKFRKGAKASIEQNKQTIKVQKEFLKVAKLKLENAH